MANLFLPNGKVQALDLLYGASKTSLETQIATLNASISSAQATLTALTSAGGYSGTITSNSVKSSGDINYNNNTSLISQMATLNGYRTSGSFLGTSSQWVNIYTLPSTVRGFFNVSVAPGNITGLYFFEVTSGVSNASLTPIITLNATYGSVRLALNIIQVQTPYNSSSGTGRWYVLLM